jgi:short-subunit dehydrogenase
MNKLIVVTGGSKGIGKAIIEKFMENDFDAITCGRNPADLVQLERELKARFANSQIHTFVADLAVKDDVTKFCRFIVERAGPVDVLVNNAGYFVPGEIASEADGTLEQMISANLYSAYHMTRGIVPGMKDRRSGHVFNMCSVASFMAYPNGGSYSISKFALLGFSKTLRVELRQHAIRVTSVMPGATKTRSWEDSGLPDERLMDVSDIAETIYAAWSLSSRSVVEEIIIRPMLGDI